MPDNPNPTPDPLERGIEFLRQQHRIYARNAWVSRLAGWLFGWGAAAVAAFGGVSERLIKGNENLTEWCGFIAAILIAINQIVKPDQWAEAYYRGHVLLESAIGDYALGRATPQALSDAWHQAESGLPGASSAGVQKRDFSA